MIRELEEKIIQNIRIIPEVPMSLLLSGGIDSSLVLALLRKVYLDVPISTFTLARSREYPDMIFARMVADLFKTDHNEIIINDEEFRKFSVEFNKIRQYDCKGDINVFILCGYARTNSNIIVTGDGGDECFGGYWMHKYPLGHKESGKIKCFEDIHPDARKYLEDMKSENYIDFLYKEKAQKEDFQAVWEYFISVMAPDHLEPLLHTARILDINVYTPLFSETLIEFLKNIIYTERIGRNIEKKLASKYLPKSIIDRKSIGFDAALKMPGE